jgi:hypothetical protein
MSESNGTTPELTGANGTGPGPADSNGSTAKPDLVALRAEIKQTRADLGETVQALAARADVKARAKEQVEQTKQRLLDQAAITGERLRAVAGQAAANVKESAGQAAANVRESAVVSGDATVRVRRNEIPVALIVAGLAAVAGVILIMRGRRR